MNFRCSSCHQTVWIPVENRSRSVHADCRGCGQSYELKAWRKLLASGDRLAKRARELARAKSIDLPGAYSVLLGVMTVEAVRELSGSQRKAVPAGVSKFDPAFGPAVAAGHLTHVQALQRGQREAYAATVSQRHDLPLKLAYDVADNRMSLLEALREGRTRQQAAKKVPMALPGGIPVSLALGLGLAVGLGLFVVLALRAPTTTTWTDVVTTAVGESTVVTNATGQVLQVAGPNPQSVLRAFCRIGNGKVPLEEISVIPASARQGRARLGLLRDPAEPGSLLSILIQENSDIGQWFVGDGTSLVSPEPAPDGAYRLLPGPAPAEG